MTINGGQKIDQLVNLRALPLLQHNNVVPQLHYCHCCTYLPINFKRWTAFTEQHTKILELLYLGKQLTHYIMWENHFPAVNHGFRFGSDDQYHQTRSASSRPDFLTAASTMEALNRAHLDSMSPQDEGKASLEVGVKDLTDRILCQMFPVHPLIQLTTRWQSVDSSALLFSKCPKHMAADPMIQQLGQTLNYGLR